MPSRRFPDCKRYGHSLRNVIGNERRNAEPTVDRNNHREILAGARSPSIRGSDFFFSVRRSLKQAKLDTFL